MNIDFGALTLIHVVLSIAGIFAGLALVGGLIAGVRLDGWFGVFLATQLVILAMFVGLGRAALRGFSSPRPAQAA